MEPVPDVTPDLPPRIWRMTLAMLGRLPARAMSRAFGFVADFPLPRRSRASVLGSFARAVGIDLSEAELSLDEYPSLNAFFVRRLRPGSRRWPDDPAVIASPVDGIVGRLGPLRNGRAIQAKGHEYTVADLLADEVEAARFDGGAFLTLYLSPRHYHRIHAPAPGTISRASYIPGTLLPVNAPAVMHVPGLFARNERLVCYLDSVRGRVGVVAVGAYNVGRISAFFDPTWNGDGSRPWVTNRCTATPRERVYHEPHPVEAGGEIMAFHLGSTVVLLLEPGVDLSDDLSPGSEVRVGEPISS
jgi:phosphatidylserine decarboxylase